MKRIALEKQPKCSLTDEWVKKKWWYIYMYVCVYVYIREYYSAIKMNEIMPFAATWMDLETVVLSEVRERQISYDITYMYNLIYDTNEHIYETETEA